MQSVQLLACMVSKTQSHVNARVKPGTNEGAAGCVPECGEKVRLAVQNVWCFLLQYFPILQTLWIVSMASSFIHAPDQSKSHDH